MSIWLTMCSVKKFTKKNTESPKEKGRGRLETGTEPLIYEKAKKAACLELEKQRYPMYKTIYLHP